MLSRQQACKYLVDAFKWPYRFWIDDAPANSFGEALKAWPMRCYLVDCKAMQMAVVSEPDGADVNLAAFLDRCNAVIGMPTGGRPAGGGSGDAASTAAA